MVMQREDQTLRNPIDMIVHVQPWMLLAIVPLVYIFEGVSSLIMSFVKKNERSCFLVLEF